MVTFPKLIGLLLLTIGFENTIMAMTRPPSSSFVTYSGARLHRVPTYN